MFTNVEHLRRRPEMAPVGTDVAAARGVTAVKELAVGSLCESL